MKKYRILGQMSGTSLDGMDLAICEFSMENSKWEFQIEDAVTIKYSDSWLQKIFCAKSLNAFDFISLHKEYGTLIGKEIKHFLQKRHVDFISMHGHTIFHQPEKRITFQLGDGAFVAAETGISTLCDFRNLDSALGGQAAPLVPIGDRLLFAEYEFCLNLGGFANISYRTDNQIVAYDICPVNMLTNLLSNRLGKDFDYQGKLGQAGKLNQALLVELNQQKYYSKKIKKSLSREWFEEAFYPLIAASNLPPKDLLRTVYEHVAIQISLASKQQTAAKILVTGGGAHNHFLMERIQFHNRNTIIKPSSLLIDYKEALIFAFLGVLRIQNKINCLKAVTGASRNNVGGVLWQMYD